MTIIRDTKQFMRTLERKDLFANTRSNNLLLKFKVLCIRQTFIVANNVNKSLD